MTSGVPLSLQQDFWNRWNASHREAAVGEISRRQGEVVCGWLTALGRQDLNIIEIGCGTGWLCPQLTRFGRVIGTDLSDEVLARARQRVPEADFVAGDFMTLPLGIRVFDVAVTLEVLSHVADQRAFVGKLACHLKVGGYLMLATQNRFVLEHCNRVAPPGPGQLRRWVDRRELRNLLTPDFEVLELFSVTPMANRGIMRLANSRLLNRPLRAMVGDRIETLKEAAGLGWTLMALARRRELA